MLCPGKPGERWARALGTRGRERASLPARRPVRARPAGSVSLRGGGGKAGSGSDHFNCGSASGARARDTARSRRSARPVPGGGGAGGGGALGAETPAPAAHPDGCQSGAVRGSRPASARGSRGAALAPPCCRLRFLRGGWAHAPFLRREETLPSQLCDIRLHSRADVSRCKFKSCHWPGATRLFPHLPPTSPHQARKPMPLRGCKAGSFRSAELGPDSSGEVTGHANSGEGDYTEHAYQRTTLNAILEFCPP
ncbi:uncharacterized protein LOC128568480 [Nycticebus coucang]|uniref:uncharacterized protein LOC128568480 n=1 Tax=Nycticebus coucang TaxID=9470 RepID=UPI00234DCC09|nr:uncharacterized protein LOC128568480 [Nycticebus coucang]